MLAEIDYVVFYLFLRFIPLDLLIIPYWIVERFELRLAPERLSIEYQDRRPAFIVVAIRKCPVSSLFWRPRKADLATAFCAEEYSMAED
jgi:hypothetical protein